MDRKQALEFIDRYEKEIGNKLTVIQTIKVSDGLSRYTGDTTQWEGEGGVFETIEKYASKANKEDEKVKNRDKSKFLSELAAIESIAQIARLTEDEKEQFTDALFETHTVPSNISTKVKTAFSANLERKVIAVLRDIHNEWVRNKGNNFQDKKRDKDYQFVDLFLMSFDEDGAMADFMFMESILEACGIQIDKEKLEEEFKKEQMDFLAQNNIYDYNSFLEYIKRAEYKALEGVTTKRGSKKEDAQEYYISAIIKNEPDVAEHMAGQAAKRSGIDILSQQKTAADYAGYARTEPNQNNIKNNNNNITH